MDYRKLSFDYYSTGAVNVRYFFKDGRWSDPVFTTDEVLPIHMSALCLHYGLQVFEGVKAFRGVDGEVRIFRPDQNAARMRAGAEKLCLPVVPEEMFVRACVDVVRKNIDGVPSYETGASLYLRPLLIGTSPRLGVRPADEAMFVVFSSPIGPYFSGGVKPIHVMVDRGQDRSAPLGTGDVKVGGNYASSMLSYHAAHELGYAAVLYTDPVEHRYIEECGAANFIAIRNNTYITPASSSILPSITNRSLRTIAADLGYAVEQRKVSVEELSSFDEAGACGTGAVIAPIDTIYDPLTDKTIEYSQGFGPHLKSMYDALHEIQYGIVEDRHGWVMKVV